MYAAHQLAWAVVLGLVYGQRKGPLLAWYDRPPIQYGYEYHASRMIMSLHGDLAVDVGASAGQYTLWLARNFRRVVAVEAHPFTARVLKNRLKRSSIGNVRLVEAAVADVDGEEVALNLSVENPRGGSIVKAKDGGSIQVSTVTLDSLLSGEGGVDFVKVDVEGAEWLVLKGAAGMMPKIRRWLIELHDAGRKSDLDRLLKAYGYRTVWVERDPGYPHVVAVREDRGF